MIGQKNRVITVAAGDGNTGCTMVAQSLAEYFSEDEKVLLVMASGKYGDGFFHNEEKKSIDRLRPNLISGNLENYEVMQVMINKKKLWILPGVRDTAAAIYYPENSMEFLIKMVSEYDRVVIDCGNYFHLGLAISALKVSDRVLTVITQDPKAVYRFKNMQETVFMPLGIKTDIILNQHRRSVSLLSDRQIHKITGIETIYKIPYVSCGAQAETEKKTLMHNLKFSKGIGRIAKSVDGSEVGDRSWIGNLIYRNT